MGQHSTFNKDNVLDNALMLFWSRGFAASSLRQLEEVTELHPGSLYHHFTNKEGLYIQVLDHYINHYLQKRLDKYLYSGNSLEGLRKFFTAGYRRSGELQYQNCCFLVCSSTELHLLPVSAKKMIREALTIILNGLKHQINKAIHRQQLPSSLNIDETTNELLSLFLSLQLRARIHLNQHQLDALVKQSLHRILRFDDQRE